MNMTYAIQYLNNLFAREEGQDLIEYALLLGLITIGAVVSIGLVGEDIATIWDTIQTTLTTALAG